MSSVSPNTVFRVRNSPRQVASPDNLSKERESRSLSGTRPGAPLTSPHRTPSKYTEPERTSSSSFKPPMSKEALALKKQTSKSSDPPDTQSTSLFSFLKNVFSTGGNKGTSGTTSNVSSNTPDNKSSLIVKVMEKKIDSTKKIETNKDEIHLIKDRVDENMDKKDNITSYNTEDMDSETNNVSNSTFINESEKDVPLVHEKPSHKKPKVPFSYDPRKLKASQTSSFFPIEPTEILQPTMLPSMPSDCPGDKLLAAKMKKIEQFKRRHLVPPTVYDPDQTSEPIAHPVNSSHSGIKQEFIFPPREIKARRSPSSQFRSNRVESNRSELSNSGNKWNIDDNMGMSTYKTYRQPAASPRRSSPHSSNVAPADGGRPVLQKSSYGYPSYRVQSSPKLYQPRAQSSPKTSRAHYSPKSHRAQSSPKSHRAQSSPKSHRAQSSPKSHRAQSSPKSHRAQSSPKSYRAQHSPKTYQALAQSSPKTYQSFKAPKKSSSKTREDWNSMKSRIRSKSIPDRMYVSSRSEHATVGSKSLKRHKSVVPAKSNTSQTSLIDDRDIPITYGKLTPKGKSSNYQRSRMSSNSKSNLAMKRTNSKSNLFAKKSNSRSNISAKKTNSNAILYAKKSDSKSSLHVKRSNSRSNISAQRSDSKFSLSPKHSRSNLSAQKADSNLNLAARKSNSRSNVSTKKSNSKLNLSTKKSNSKCNLSTKKTKSRSNVSSKKSNSKINLHPKKVNSKTKLSVKRTSSNTSQKSIESKKPTIATIQSGTLEPQLPIVSKQVSHGYSKQQITTAEVAPTRRRHAMYIYPHQITTESPSAIDARQTMSAVQQSPNANRGPNKTRHSSPPNQYSPGSIRKSQSYRYSPERPGSKPTASWRLKKSDKQNKQLSPFRQLISKENSSPQMKDSLDNRSIGDYSYIYNIDSEDVGKNKSNKDNKKNSSWASRNKRPSKQQSNSSMQTKNNQSSKNVFASNALQSGMTSRNKNVTKQPRYSSPERSARQSSSGTNRLDSPKSRSPPMLQSSSDFKLTQTNVDTGKVSPCQPASPRTHMPSPMTSGSVAQIARSPSIGSIIRKSTSSKDPTPEASLSRFEEAMIVSPINLEALSYDSHEQNHETHSLASTLNPYKLNQSSNEVIEYVQDYPPEGEDYLGNNFRTDAPWENNHRVADENYINEDNINITSGNHNRSATSLVGDQCNSATPNFFNVDHILETSRLDNLGFDDYILMNCSNSSIYKSSDKWNDDEMKASLTEDSNRMISSSTSNIFTDYDLHADMDVIPTASLVGHSSRPQRGGRISPVDEMLQKDKDCNYQHPVCIVHLSAKGSNSPNTPSNKNKSPSIKNSSKTFNQKAAPASKGTSFYNTKDDPRFRMGREARSREITCCSPARSRSQNNANKIPSITMATSKKKEVSSRSNSPKTDRKSITPKTYRPPARELSKDDSRPLRGHPSKDGVTSQKPVNSPLRYRSIEYPPSFLSPLNLGPKKPEPRIGSNVNGTGTKPKVPETQPIKRKSRSVDSTRKNEDEDTSTAGYYASPILSKDVINKTISFFSTIFNSVDETIKNATKREKEVEVLDVSSDFIEPPPPKSSFQESLKKDRAESPWLIPMPDTAVGNKVEEKVVLETIKTPVASCVDTDTEYDEISSPVDTPHAFVSSATRNGELP